MPNKKYKILSHTADIKVEFIGKDYIELIDAVFQFYFDNIEILSQNNEISNSLIEFEDEGFEFLMVRLINELIFLKDIGKIVKSYKLIKIEKKYLKLEITLISGFGNFKEELKSATYYQLKTKKKGNIYYIQITIDV